MLSSIHPLGERTRGNRWAPTAAYYVVGSILGGGVMGFGLGVLGSAAHGLVAIDETAMVWTAVLASLVAATLDLFGVRVPSPERQVSEVWMNRYRPWVYAGGYGFQLGTGVVTYIKTASIYLLWLLVLLSGSVAGGALVGAWFGLVRGSSVLTLRRVRDTGSLRRYFRRMASLAPAARVVTVAFPLVAAATILAIEFAGS